MTMSSLLGRAVALSLATTLTAGCATTSNVSAECKRNRAIVSSLVILDVLLTAATLGVYVPASPGAFGGQVAGCPPVTYPAPGTPSTLPPADDTRAGGVLGVHQP